MKFLTAILTSMLVIIGPACERGSDKSAPSASESMDPLAAGMAAFKEGRLETAVELYQQALKDKPGSAVIYNLIGMAYRFQYNKNPGPELKDKEIAAFEKACELDPKFVVALINLGSTFYFKGDKDKAAGQFKKVLALVPNHPQAAELKKMIAEAEADAKEKTE